MIKWSVLLLLLPSLALAQTTIPMQGLNVPSSRVPQWYAFDQTVYDAAQTTWPVYDSSCLSGPCGSGFTPYGDAPGDVMDGCSASNTGNAGSVNCHISNAPNNSVIFMPAGTYTVGTTGQVKFNRSNVVLRGAGIGATNILVTSDDRGFTSGSCDANTGGAGLTACNSGHLTTTTAWTGGYTIGTKVLNVTDASLFTGETWVKVRASGSINTCPYLDKYTNSGYPNNFDSLNYLDKIVSVDTGANTVTIERGLRIDYSLCAGSKTVGLYQPLVNIGFEHITINTNMTNLATIGAFPGGCDPGETKFQYINWNHVADSWITDSEVTGACDSWLVFGQAARNWVQGNSFHDLSSGVVFNTEGINMSTAAVDNIISNNYIYNTRVAGNLFTGAEGNVYAYNYRKKETTYNTERSFFNHGTYVRHTLFEGNDLSGELLLADDWWGRNGPGHTAYRNRIDGSNCFGFTDSITVDFGVRCTDIYDNPTCNNPGHNGTATGNDECGFGGEPLRCWQGSNHGDSCTVDGNCNSNDCSDDHHQYTGTSDGLCDSAPNYSGPWISGSDINVIGNTVGAIVGAPFGRASCNPAQGSSSFNSNADRVWIENNATRDENTGNVHNFNVQAAFRDASCGTGVDDVCPGTNKDISSPDVSWSGTYPTSFYITTGAPTWWCEEACAWDQTGIGAFGDDYGFALCKLPAQIRAESRTCTALGAGGTAASMSGGSITGGSAN